MPGVLETNGCGLRGGGTALRREGGSAIGQIGQWEDDHATIMSLLLSSA